MMNGTLYFGAKAPRIGLAKTRLGRAIGHERAVALYAAFLHDLAARFTNAPFALAWYVTPPDAWGDIAPLAGRAGRRARVIAQGEGDWTARQRALFRGAAERDEERIILIACDSPHLTVETVAAAFRTLDHHELVVGPTLDGGYYLIGMRGWHDVLHGISMSTATVTADIIARAGRAGLSVGQVETTFDVDEVADLGHLCRLVDARSDLPATRAALMTLGLQQQHKRRQTYDESNRDAAAGHRSSHGQLIPSVC